MNPSLLAWRGLWWNVKEERALIVRINRAQKQRCWEEKKWWRGYMKCHIMLPKQHDILSGIKEVIQTQSITLELTSLPESSIINHRLRSFWRHHMVLFDRASESRWLPSWHVFIPGCQKLPFYHVFKWYVFAGNFPDLMWTLSKNYCSLSKNTALNTNKCKKKRKEKAVKVNPELWWQGAGKDSTCVPQQSSQSTLKMKVNERSNRKLTHPCSRQQPLRVYLLHFHPAPLHYLIHRHLVTIPEVYFSIVFTSTTGVFPSRSMDGFPLWSCAGVWMPRT